MPEPAIKIDGFLKVPDIPGPSTRDGHEEEIEIFGADFQITAPHDPNSLSRRGRVSVGIFTCWKHYDKSSPYLKQALFENKPLDEVVFSARRTIEGATSDYLVVTMTEASVIAYKMAPGEDDEADMFVEKVGFAFKTIKFVYDSDYEYEINVHVGV